MNKPQEYPARMNLSKDFVKKYLETEDTSYLMNAFLWDESPQGYDHWRDIAYGEKPLDEASRAWLEEVSR